MHVFIANKKKNITKQKPITLILNTKKYNSFSVLHVCVYFFLLFVNEKQYVI